MTDLATPEHLGALAVTAVVAVPLVVAARRRPGAWLKVLAVALAVAEVSW